MTIIFLSDSLMFLLLYAPSCLFTILSTLLKLVDNILTVRLLTSLQ